MSLLLDALKKAAEKKARKNQQDKDAQTTPGEESLQQSGAGVDQATGDVAGAQDSTRTVPLADMTDISQATVEVTSLDATDIDPTDVVDATQQTILDDVAFDAGTDAQAPGTPSDVTEVDAPGFDSSLLDRTEVEATEIEPTLLDNTELDATEVVPASSDVTELEATEIEATELDATELVPVSPDVTEMEATELEATELDATEVERVAADVTEMDATEVEATEIDATEVEPVVLDATELETDDFDNDGLDATVWVGRGEADDSEVAAPAPDVTEVEATHNDSTSDAITRSDSGSGDETDMEALEFAEPPFEANPVAAGVADDTEMERFDEDVTGHETTGLESTDIMDSLQLGGKRFAEDDSLEPDLSALELDVLDHPEATFRDIEETDLVEPVVPGSEHSAPGIEDTDSIRIVASPLGGADKTETVTNPMAARSALEGADDQMDETDLEHSEDDTERSQFEHGDLAPGVISETGSETLELKPIKYLHQLGDAELVDAPGGEGDGELEPLTLDDVTEFMGDGVKDDVAWGGDDAGRRATDAEQALATDPDSLSLTDFSLDDGDQTTEQRAAVMADPTASDTQSIPGYRDSSRARGNAAIEGGVPVSTGAEVSGTIDIEKLTNDETVTVKDNTGTRTFAPDNYDRTLMKLADQDVSRIFPGMKPESNVVMTPDYAKKIFINKSHNVKRRYYRYYLGIAALVLAAMIFWGLDDIQQESQTIDNSLARLKRDPMPGDASLRAKAKAAQVAPQVDDQALRILASVDEEPLADAQVTDTADEMPAAPQPADSDSAQDASETASQATPDPAVASVTPAQPVDAEPAPPAAVVSARRSDSVARKRRDSAVAAPAEPAQGSLSISSSQKVDDKDRMLSDAFSAYESGDLNRSVELYQQVMAQDGHNRDALLGLAAIYLRNGQIEQAINSYRQVLLDNPKDSVALASLISVVNVDPAAGESEIKKLLDEQPQAAYLHFVLGNMYGSQKRWQEAQAAYFEAVRYKPRDPNYAYNLAVSLEHIQKPRSAAAFYQRALENLSSTTLANFDRNVVSQRIQVLQQ